MEFFRNLRDYGSIAFLITTSLQSLHPEWAWLQPVAAILAGLGFAGKNIAGKLP